MSQKPEMRNKHRSINLPHPMVEIKFPGVPTYQLKIRDSADEGIGIIVRPDSGFLDLIDIGQELNLKLISPSDSDYKGPSGYYLARIEHITKIQKKPLKSHLIVGLALLKKGSSETSAGRPRIIID